MKPPRNPGRFKVGWDHGWDSGVRIYDSDDLLGLLEEPLSHPDLREAFIDAFEHEWCQRGPYRLEHWHMLKLSWERFAHLVRSRHRYLFLLDQGTDDDELVSPARMLEAVAQAIHNTPWRMLRRVPAGTPLFRARAHNEAEKPARAVDLGSPPPASARPNRMSPAGISMFYGAEDAGLAEAEVRAGPGDVVTSGRWTTTRDLWCLDLRLAEPIPSLFDMTARSSRPWLRFLAHFAVDLSKPASAVTAEVDYVPTQIVTEYVRDVLRTPSGEAVAAVAYTSAVQPDKTCWVVFAGPEECVDDEERHGRALLRLDRSTVIRGAPPTS
jgi:hypothetical protein